MTIDAIEFVGFLAAGLVFSSFCMKRMLALRATAIASNIAFIAYGALGGLTPILALHVVLLPLNLWRIHEILRLLRRVKQGAGGSDVAGWLRPYARSLIVPAGTVIFRQGDQADRLYFIESGVVGIDEVGVTHRDQTVFGEMGMFSATGARTASATALEATRLLWVSRNDLALICHQHPDLTLHLIRLVTQRLLAEGSGAAGAPPTARLKDSGA